MFFLKKNVFQLKQYAPPPASAFTSYAQQKDRRQVNYKS
jgi:hypothetical protein